MAFLTHVIIKGREKVESVVVGRQIYIILVFCERLLEVSQLLL